MHDDVDALLDALLDRLAGRGAFPRARAEELDPEARAIATRLASVRRLGMLGAVGLPVMPQRMAAWLGLAAGGTLDATLDVPGRGAAPVIAHVEDAIAGHADAEAVVRAVTAVRERGEAVFEALLAGDPGYDLSSLRPNQRAAVRAPDGWELGAVRVVAAIGRELGPAGLRAAERAAADDELPSEPMFRIAVALELGASRAAWRDRLDAAAAEASPQARSDYAAVLARFR